MYIYIVCQKYIYIYIFIFLYIFYIYIFLYIYILYIFYIYFIIYIFFFIIALTSHGDMQSIQDEVSVDEVEETTDGASTGSGLLCFVFRCWFLFFFFLFFLSTLQSSVYEIKQSLTANNINEIKHKNW